MSSTAGKSNVYSGRLVVDGDTGKLYAQPEDMSIHQVDADGVPTHDLVSSMREVRYDPEVGDYIYVTDGRSHYDVNDNPEVENSVINGTTGPLYDNNGMLVVEGDPHHDHPLPDDPHADGALFNSDEDGPNVTGSTVAYQGKHGA